ncbi:hypothetical protein CAPTEDRAFT_102772 [Capitella teleta]|uniref:Microsomal glutathione S-transferase 1 n=1 Tax=Capitella teleta TaxID=283909 RepID=R7UGZ9_CAPTE|nr:hypothetical protein CAPTEDRAFT_102772 [Capitella teleta]|eukprot:ELU05373.1 hypothetical protein CAPTEDRAFT_102772 [Capitella teleta]
MSAFTLENPVFRDFAYHGTIVLLKMGAMSFLTAIKRFSTGAFASKEDYIGKKPKEIVSSESVERVRRNHLNDLENIPLFLLVGLFYVATSPEPSQALLHFRIFTFSRIMHTLSYQIPIRQPARALAFFAGVGVTVSMAVHVLRTLH